MKKIIYYISAMMFVVFALTLSVFATETETAVVTESALVEEAVAEDASATETEGEGIVPPVSESITEAISIDEEAASEIIGIIEGSDSKTQAILDIADKLGITYEEAEEVLNTFLEVGDKYLGENELWIGFKKDVQDNLQFWVIVVVCVLAVLTIIGIIFVQMAKTNPTMRKAMFGTREAVDICKKSQTENSQTLVNLEKLFAEAVEKESVYQKLIAEKEESILKLEETIKRLEEESKKEKKNMVLAESYNLQILKLICSRTALPLSDRAAIDLWYTRAMESLKSELSAEDIAKIENVAAVIGEVTANG